MTQLSAVTWRRCRVCGKTRSSLRFLPSDPTRCRGCRSRVLSKVRRQGQGESKVRRRPQSISHLKCLLFSQGFQLVETLASVPKTSGVYLLVFNSEIQYIGQSSNLYSRLQGHLLVKLIDVLIFIRETDNHRQLEMQLIQDLDPALNTAYRRRLASRTKTRGMGITS